MHQSGQLPEPTGAVCLWRQSPSICMFRREPSLVPFPNISWVQVFIICPSSDPKVRLFHHRNVLCAMLTKPNNVSFETSAKDEWGKSSNTAWWVLTTLHRHGQTVKDRATKSDYTERMTDQGVGYESEVLSTWGQRRKEVLMVLKKLWSIGQVTSTFPTFNPS